MSFDVLSVLNGLLIVLAMTSVFDLLGRHTTDGVDAGVCAALIMPVLVIAVTGFASWWSVAGLVMTVFALRSLLHRSPNRIETDPNDSIFAVLRRDLGIR